LIAKYIKFVFLFFNLIGTLSVVPHRLLLDNYDLCQERDDKRQWITRKGLVESFINEVNYIY
jgi:hypothetical protein